MGGVPRQPSVVVGQVVWYLSGGLDAEERREFAVSAGGAVLKGERGAAAGGQLRRAGFAGRLWLDPSSYESATGTEQLSILGDRWLQLQDELAVVEKLSPGTYVSPLDDDGLARAIDRELEWTSAAGEGRISLALHARWLTDGVDALTRTLSQARVPVAVAFAERNDPLGLAGAVQGLVTLLQEVPDVAVLRCDLGALGAVAHGAVLSAIGTSATVRHVVPPGQTGGGVPHDRSPSVFLRELLDFKLGSHLDEFPREASPSCDLACCRGGLLRRFNDEHTLRDARVHNRHAVLAAVDRVLSLPQASRAASFRAMCLEAEYAAVELAAKARRPLQVRPQVSAWARLS